MLVVRLILVLTILATVVLGAAYLLTKDRRYIRLLKQLIKFILGFFAVLILLYFITRVLHL